MRVLLLLISLSLVVIQDFPYIYAHDLETQVGTNLNLLRKPEQSPKLENKGCLQPSLQKYSTVPTPLFELKIVMYCVLPAKHANIDK